MSDRGGTALLDEGPMASELMPKAGRQMGQTLWGGLVLG